MPVNRSKGINKEFLHLTIDFVNQYEEMSNDVALAILSGSLVSKKLIEAKIVKALTPIITEYFRDSVHAGNKVVKGEVSKLVNTLDVPFKYNLEMLDTINKESIWAGYADLDAKKTFSTKEITAMKKTILMGKYSNWDEKTTMAAIKNVVGGTDRRARLIARMETTRLNTAAHIIYFGKKKVRDEYKLVWSAYSGTGHRHYHMNDKEADEEGMFYDSKTGGLISGPPYSSSPWNCMCTTNFVKK